MSSRSPDSRSPDSWVTASDGLQLAVYRDGDPSATEVPSAGPSATRSHRPLVLAVHGYPDSAAVWDRVSELLANNWQVVRYDVRGAGASQRPAHRHQYRMDQLVADLAAVITAASPDAPVHLLAHDWGSIQAWAGLTDPRLAGRVASFTSISGPCLDYVRPWLVNSLRRGRFGPVLRQMLHSYYLLAFQLPVLPELLWRSGLLDRILDGRSRASHRGYRRSLADQVNGLQLYRANLFRRGVHHVGRTTDVPVQVLAPDADPFVTAVLQLQAPVPYARTLFRRPVPGGHWLPVTDPGLVARACGELIELVEFGRSADGLGS